MHMPLQIGLPDRYWRLALGSVNFGKAVLEGER